MNANEGLMVVGGAVLSLLLQSRVSSVFVAVGVVGDFLPDDHIYT
jgi:hypothetical protein